MQSVSITSTSLKPLHAHKTVITYHDTGAVGTALIEWSHIKQKAKNHPNNAQAKMHFFPHQLPAAHTAGMVEALQVRTSKPSQDRKARGSFPSFPCKGMEHPVYGACNANLSSALLHDTAQGLRAAKHAFCPPCRGGGMLVTACVPHTEGILAVPPPKPGQSPKHHKQTQQSILSAQRVEAVGRDTRVFLFQ